jgi:N-acetylglucosaminyldiphosphoundecaprenol N-acetyl-beta-D-mannosaminyltransferase
MACQRGNILNVDFDLIDYEQTVKIVSEWRQMGKRAYITITNPHSVLMCHRDEKMRKATACAGLSLPDGTGIIWAANILGYKHHGRVTGPTLMLSLSDLGRRHGFRHYFYGAAEGVAQNLSERLRKKFTGLEVTGTYSPPFRALSEKEDLAIIEQINESCPDIVWIGLGAPKQEKWMADHLGKIKATAMIGVGAAFDVHSENVQWAPPWIRKLGIEWAYRLALEPRRMWRRNLDSPLFLYKILVQWFAESLRCNRWFLFL